MDWPFRRNRGTTRGWRLLKAGLINKDITGCSRRPSPYTTCRVEQTRLEAAVCYWSSISDVITHYFAFYSIYRLQHCRNNCNRKNESECDQFNYYRNRNITFNVKIFILINKWPTSESPWLCSFMNWGDILRRCLGEGGSKKKRIAYHSTRPDNQLSLPSSRHTLLIHRYTSDWQSGWAPLCLPCSLKVRFWVPF